MAEREPAKLDKYQPARRAPGDYDALPDEDDTGQEDAEEDAEYEEYDGAPGAASADTEPDVLLDVPALKVEEIHLEVEDLNAHVSLQAEVLSLLKLHVGADVSLGHVSLEIKGVDAVAQLKVRLDQVEAIIDRVMTTIDNNPQILSDLTRGLGEAAGQIGRGAGEALEEVGAGAGTAVESVGGGLQEATEDLGRGADRAVEDVIEDTGVTDDARPGRGAADSAAGAGQTGQRSAEQAAARGQTARRRPASPSDTPRPVRQEPPAPVSSPRRDQPARRDRRARPQ